MPRSPWTSTARAAERPARAVPPWGIALLVLGVVAALAALQWRQHAGDSNRQIQALDRLVQAAASEDPRSDPVALMAEVERLLQERRPAEALALLTALQTQGSPDQQAWARQRAWYARWQLWHAQGCAAPNIHAAAECEADADALTADAWPLLRESETRLPAAMRELLQQWLWQRAPLAQLQAHASALTAADPAAAPLPQALSRAAQAALAAGLQRRSAELWLWAAEASPPGAARLHAWGQALRALESAGQWPLLLRWLQDHEDWFVHDRQGLLEAVRLSRAAGQPQLALRYVNKLLALTERTAPAPTPPAARLSDATALPGSALGPRLWAWQRAQAHAGAWPGGWRRAAWPASGPTSETAPSSRSAPNVKPSLDLEVMELAYQVFLENRKLDDALALAQRVAQQRPDDLRWQRRLAQVAEWNQRPELALDAWWQAARLSDEPAAWEAVRRLSIGLLRDDAYVAYLQQRLQRQPSETATWLELASVQERLGDPEAAWQTLQRGWQQLPDAALARALAELAERLGRTREAIVWWNRSAAPPWPAELAQRVALLHLLLDEREQALAVLRQALEPQTDTPEADDYRRLRAELALESGDADDASRQLRALAERPQASAQDLADWEYALEVAGRELEAAQAAALLWHRHQQEEALIRALTRWQNHARLDAAQTLLASLTEGQRAQLERNPRYLVAAARQAWQTGQWPEARRLYGLALQRAPQDADIVEAALWFTLDTQDVAAVRRHWSRHGAVVQDRLELRVAVALTLGDVAEAWRLTAPTLRERRHDPLWLTQAADILQALDRHDEAWQLRLHTWRQLRRQPLAPQTMLPILRARLSAFLQPGDAEWAALREVAALPDTAAARSVLLAQWIQRGQYSAARAWMLRHVAPGLAQPGWAELAVALAEDDREALQRLLEDPRPLPRRDVVQAARRLDEAQAATLAAEGLERYPDDDLLHEQWVALTRSQRNRFSVELQRTERPAWDELQTLLHWQALLTPHLRFSVNLQRFERSLQRPDLLAAVPDERQLQLRLDAGDARESWQWRLGWLEALGTHASLGLRWQRRWDRLQLGLEAGWAEPASASDNLRLIGLQDWLGADLVWPLQPTLALNVRASAARWRAQPGGVTLGRGQRLDAILSWQAEANPHGLRIDLGWNRQRYRAADPNDLPALRALLPAGATLFAPDAFVPRSRTQWALTVSHGLTLQAEPRRGWLPYAALTWSTDSELGAGVGGQFGLAGSVLGHDRGLIGLQLDRNLGANPGLTRRLLLRYWADL
ncbi:Tetratricopeptide repeat protein [Tepidimonas alkaliphilus]|uniref:Tetratricopeptide repeat protein n=1 Tax=Tepidimonas alkaliphilus TaxID=2588942 RepID=A0A554W8K4_9BURK|nr:tetratricopeptide repeat protein [Tepidimonas alkaliphilus]TSE19899.1 Tetratricopeptide repeat protein [Tepidimonas alkaliphilus]